MKKLFKVIYKYLFDSKFRFRVNVTKFFLYKKMPDKKMLDKLYYSYFGCKINWDNPQTFNEKLQWLKLHDRKEIYTTMVDKYEVKKYVADRLGDEFVIPTLGVWNSFDEIDFTSLPNQFVLKCTHDSGGVVICKDKASFDIHAARKIIEKALKVNFYYIGREWPYKNIKPRIIAEKYMADDNVSGLWDYKFFCFGGKCKCMKVDFDRFTEHHANYYDPQGNFLNFGETVCPPGKQKNIVLPVNMDKLIAFAEKLSHDVPFLRGDFYDVNGQIYFGELTFYPASGFGTFTDDEWDKKLGEWIELPKAIGGGYILLIKEFIIRLHNKSIYDDLMDYKIHCFNGEPKITLVCCNRFSDTGLREDFFDENWCHLPLKRPEHPNLECSLKRPLKFEQMKELATKLSKNIPFIRTDFYEIKGNVYFGELTFYPASGFSGFDPEQWDNKLGKWIELPIERESGTNGQSKYMDGIE